MIEFTVRVLSYLAQSPVGMWDAPMFAVVAGHLCGWAGGGLIWPMRTAWRLALLPFMLPMLCLPHAWRLWLRPL